MRPDGASENFPDVRNESSQGNRDGDETENFFVEHILFAKGWKKQNRVRVHCFRLVQPG